MRSFARFVAFGTLLGAIGAPAPAQERAVSVATPSVRAYEIPAGTQFLVGLESKLSTKDCSPGNRFKARTLEPVETPDGAIVPVGAEVRGHVDKSERAGQTGRARLWLTFDDVEVSGNRIPLIAEVTDTPGERSIRAQSEGDIESRADKGARQAEAAAGAAIGAAAGAAAHGGKGAAIGAAVGAAGGFIATSGYGQELTLEKNTKLELTLERPLYLGRS